MKVMVLLCAGVVFAISGGTLMDTYSKYVCTSVVMLTIGAGFLCSAFVLFTIREEEKYTRGE